MRLLLELQPTLDRNFVSKSIQFAVPKLIRFLLNKSKHENIESYKTKKLSEYLAYNLRITPKPRTYNDSLLVGDKNIFKLTFSSYSKEILEILNESILTLNQILMMNVKLKITNIELLENEEVSTKIKVRPMAPILSGEIKEGGTFPFYYKWKQPEFLDTIKKQLKSSYNATHETPIEENIEIVFDKNFIRYNKDISQLVKIYKKNHRAIWAPLFISGPTELIQYALDMGLGINRELGYGMIENYTPKARPKKVKKVNPNTLPDNFGNLIENNPIHEEKEIDETNFNR